MLSQMGVPVVPVICFNTIVTIMSHIIMAAIKTVFVSSF